MKQCAVAHREYCTKLSGAASDGLVAPVDSAIKAPHRVTEGDCFPGLPTE